MAGNTDNPGNAGTESANTSETDNLPGWNLKEPDWSEDGQETILGTGSSEGTESEREAVTKSAKEPEKEPEDEEAGDEEGDEAETPEASELDGKIVPDTALVTMPDGNQLSVAELKTRQMLHEDYSRNMARVPSIIREAQSITESAREKAELTASAAQRFVDKLASIIPPEPDRQLLLTGNPEDSKLFYVQTQNKAAIEKMIAEVVESKDEAKTAVSKISDEDRRLLQFEENQKLIAKLPELASDDKRAKRLTELRSLATKRFGIDQDTAQNIIDHRFLEVLHWAERGLKSVETAKSAKEKIVKTPVAPTPRRASNVQRQQMQPTSEKAIRQLARSGSFADALKLNF